MSPSAQGAIVLITTVLVLLTGAPVSSTSTVVMSTMAP